MVDGTYKLPKSWRWVRLGEVAWRDAITLQPRDQPDAVFHYLGMEHVAPGQWDEPAPVELRGAEIKSQVIVYRPGLVLYGKLRPYLNKVVVPSAEGIASTEFVPIAVNSDILEPRYLGAYLRSPSFVAHATRNTTGSRQPRMRLEALWGALIPLPPLAEQRRIVARIEELMGRVREAQRLRQEAQKDAERLWQSVLAQTFPRPGSELPEGWRWVRLREVCTLIDSGFAFRKKGAPEGDLLHLRPYNIGEDGTLNLSQRFYVPSSLSLARHKMLQPGDVLFNNTNSVELVGKTALVREPLEAAFSNHITLLRSDTTKAEGAWIALALQALWRQGFFANLCNKWIGQAGINTETLKSVLIPLPPLSEQRRIVAHLQAVQEKIQALKETQAATEAELKRLEQAILEKAFRGEL
jgi:type I restriction enzyme S subunit